MGQTQGQLAQEVLKVKRQYDQAQLKSDDTWDVGREQTEQLQKLRSAYEEYDAIFRSFRAAILRSDAAEKVNTRIPEWIPLSVH
jgi:hypothetical protein